MLIEVILRNNIDSAVKASTSDKWLDKLLSGGFLRGFTVLYGGEGSAEKSYFYKSGEKQHT